MKEYKQLMLANKAWAAEQIDDDPAFFTRQVVGQKPKFLWIGCSDSRVAPDQLTQSGPGGLFIHRNIANLVSENDLNLMSVVEYALEVLEVEHVILCGHYGCGGLIATLDGGAEGSIGSWLENARDVYDDHRDEIDGQSDREARVNRFVECNVRDQLVRLAKTRQVQRAFAARELALHGWVYDLRDGLIKSLLEIEAGTDLEAVARPERVLV